jgi:hypothetical protein
MPGTYAHNIRHLKLPLCLSASMILVELDSVAIRWLTQQTPPVATLKKKTKIRGITFVPIFVLNAYRNIYVNEI